jgi:hypothetical protein
MGGATGLFKCSAEGDPDRLPDFIGENAVQCQVCGNSASVTDVDIRPGFVQFLVKWGPVINSQGQYTPAETTHQYQVWFIDANGRLLGTEPAARRSAVPFSAVNATCCNNDQYSATISSAMPTGTTSLLIVPAFKVGTDTSVTPNADIYAPLPMGQTIAVTDVTTGSTKTVVTGTLGLQVSDPQAFCGDDRNADAFAKALAAQVNVGQEYISANCQVVTGGRRLGHARRLTANVNMNYEITVPESSTGSNVPSATDISSSLSGSGNLASLETALINEIQAAGTGASITSGSMIEVTAPSTQTQTTPAGTTASPADGSTGGASRKSPAGLLTAFYLVAGTLGVIGVLQ